MNNKTQRKFDGSIKATVSPAHARQNDRITKARWAREDRGITIATAPTGDLDALIAELVARDNLQVEQS